MVVCVGETVHEPFERDETGVPLIVADVAPDVAHEMALAPLFVREQVGCWVVDITTAELAEAEAAADAAAAAPEAEEPVPPLEAAAPEEAPLPAPTARIVFWRTPPD